MPRPLLFALLIASAASAQPSNWATLTPGAGPAVPLDGAFGDGPWETGVGASGRVEAPLYGGRARAALWATAYEDPTLAVPEFDLVVPTLGWGPAVDVGRARLGAGGRVGAALIRIGDDDAGRLQNETELAVGAWAGGALRLGRVEVWAEAEATHLTLSTPVTLLTAGGGLALRLDTPRWLQTLLR
ncbi:hypothetical protein [Rubrivirga marina]|uniref:Outer membrane protein beta-barrel domain-containing protein n=1 Tax=Rubrivirga marina TaxID=1196024 RepID=A0A271IZ35_9BACT|nr:hypothetical protein [Rubrivirga marina]PAP76074.1 hypothetical protein BSZ37_06260 [Rubrivirga marina]